MALAISHANCVYRILQLYLVATPRYYTSLFYSVLDLLNHGTEPQTDD